MRPRGDPNNSFGENDILTRGSDANLQNHNQITKVVDMNVEYEDVEGRPKYGNRAFIV